MDDETKAKVQIAIGYQPPRPGVFEQILRSLPDRPGPRRTARVLAAASTVLVAAAVGVVVLLIHINSQSQLGRNDGTPSVTAAGVAWLRAEQPGQQSIFIGVDPRGHVVGEIDVPTILRSTDGTRLYAVSGSSIEVFSALTGRKEDAIPRRSALTGYLTSSADGHYLAVLEVGANYAVELIDLRSNKSAGYMILGSAPANGAVGWIVFSANDARLYVVTDLWATPKMTVVAVTATGLGIEGRAVDGEAGHVIPGCDGLYPPLEAIGGLPVRILADGQTLVTYCPFDSRISWVDLSRLTVTGQLTPDQAGGLSVSFSADRTFLYMYDPGKHTLRAVDLAGRNLVKSSTVQADRRQLWDGLFAAIIMTAEAKGSSGSTAVSADGRTLYVTTTAGVSAYDLPHLTLKSRWSIPGGSQAIWATADGGVVYALVANQTIYVLRPDGRIVAHIALAKPALQFVVPS